MILFTASSLIAFFGYMALLINIEGISPGYLTGVTVDIPLIFTVIFALRLRCLPLAVILSIGVALFIGGFSDTPAFYRAHATLSQAFICLIIGRLSAHFRTQAISPNSDSWLSLYTALNIPSIDWVWKQRAERFINKVACWIDRVSVITIPLLVVIAFTVSQETMVALVVGYSLIWLGFFALVATPVIVIESGVRFMLSMSRSKTVV